MSKPLVRNRSIAKIVQFCSTNHLLMKALDSFQTSRTTIYTHIERYRLAKYLLLTTLTTSFEKLAIMLEKSLSYLSILLIYMQLVVCIYSLTGVFLPLGLIFLIVSMCFMGFVYTSLAVSYVRKEENKLSVFRYSKRTIQTKKNC